MDGEKGPPVPSGMRRTPSDDGESETGREDLPPPFRLSKLLLLTSLPCPSPSMVRGKTLGEGVGGEG